MNNNNEDINVDDMLNNSGNNNVSNNMNNVPNMMPNNMNVNQNMGNVPNMMNNNMNVPQNMGNVPNMMNNNMDVNQNMGNVPNMMNNNMNVPQGMGNVPNMMNNNMNVNQNMGNVPNMMPNNMNSSQNMGNVPNMMNNNMDVNQNMDVPNMMNNNMNAPQGMGNVPNMMPNNINTSQDMGNDPNKKMSAKEHMHKLKKHRALIDHHQKKTNKKLILIILGVIVLLLGITALILFLVFGGNETKHEHVEEYDEVETEKDTKTITAGSLVFNKVDTYRYSLDTSDEQKLNHTLDVNTGTNSFSFFYNMLFSIENGEQIIQTDYASFTSQGLTVSQPSAVKLSNGKTVAKMEFTGVANGYIFYYNFASDYLLRGVCYTNDVTGSLIEFEKIVTNMTVTNNANASIQQEIVAIDIQDIINKKPNQND